ncbi:MAG: DUF839 domain-containing protein [Calditrichaeota bacterium]|nr:DUF839 domain-containing protein [Calditrichota bacterium]HQU70723.1 DUF839 domain-containing protein [Calditrichia bacterium]
MDRAGNAVTSATQLNEGSNTLWGMDRLCSANLYRRRTFNLEDDIFFTGEETGNGQEFALDVRNGVLYAVPMMGRAAWESVAMVNPGNRDKVALVVGDDRGGAYLWLYVGEKNHFGDGSFLDRNGLAYGHLYAWVADNGDTTPEAFHGTGNLRYGYFAPIEQFNADSAGVPGYDALGYADLATLDAQAAVAGAFRFSRPEDVQVNPHNDREVTLASTGRGGLFPSDNWGTMYEIDFYFNRRGPITARIKIDYDADDAGNGQFSHPDFGLRSPDNLEWAGNGKIYVQEDRSTSPGSLFGGTSGIEASIWEMTHTGQLERIASMDRTAVPAGQIDNDPTDLGNWESSGILDVTDLFFTFPGEQLLLANVQAHSLTFGSSDRDAALVQGGQIFFLTDRSHFTPLDLNLSESDIETLELGGELAIAEDFQLEQNYPNPFNPTTTISFSVKNEGMVTIAIFNQLGQKVVELVNNVVAAGPHRVVWDGRDALGQKVASGIYFYKMTAGDFVKSRKMLLTK